MSFSPMGILRLFLPNFARKGPLPGTGGIEVGDVISPQMLQALVESSKSNHTGVRWVSAQVENRLLEAIYEQGLFQLQRAAS